MQDTRKIKIGLGTFDLLKGFAIIFMVIGHMASHYDMKDLNPVLSTVWMLLGIFGVCANPMFFIVSGFGFKEKTPGKMLKKTFSELLKPYLYITLAVTVIFSMVHLLQYNKGLSSAIQAAARWILALLFGLHDPLVEQKVILGIEVRACWVAWFLLTMFVAFNVLNLILRAKKTTVQFALVALSIVSGYVLSCFDFTYFCIPQGLITVGYCYTGYMFKKTKFFERKSFPIWLCIALVPITLMECFLGECSLSYNIYKNGLLDIIGAGCAGVLLFVLGAYAGQCEWKWLDYCKQIGIYTYWIMCIHSVELICFPWDKIIKSMPDYPLVAFVIELGLKFVLILVSCKVLKKVILYRCKKRKLHRS